VRLQYLGLQSMARLKDLSLSIQPTPPQPLPTAKSTEAVSPRPMTHQLDIASTLASDDQTFARIAPTLLIPGGLLFQRTCCASFILVPSAYHSNPPVFAIQHPLRYFLQARSRLNILKDVPATPTATTSERDWQFPNPSMPLRLGAERRTWQRGEIHCARFLGSLPTHTTNAVVLRSVAYTQTGRLIFIL
jgi:hypothetical protein